MFVNPVGTEVYDEYIKGIIEEIKRPDVEATVTHLNKGPTHLEYHYYEHLIIDEMLHLLKNAEREGYDAFVIGCFYDPGLREAREIVSMPVIAPAETCMHVASTLGHKFSIIVGRRKWIPKMEDNAYVYGLERKLASFREMKLSVPQMVKNPGNTKEAILKAAKKAVEEDGAEVIVLGCTMESGFIKDLIRILGVPVLDAVVISWKFAEMCADLYHQFGLSHCKIGGYESPPQEEGWLK